jgi:hypothetical protein
MHCLYASVLPSFLTAISHSSLTLTSPLLIPSLLIQFNLDRRLKALNEAHDDIYNFEKVLGIRYDHHEKVDVGRMEFAPFSKGLNAVTADLAYMALACSTTKKQLDFLDSIAEKYDVLARLNNAEDEEDDRVKMLLLEAHAHLRSWNDALEGRAEYLSKRAQALVQTVSLVSQPPSK